MQQQSVRLRDGTVLPVWRAGGPTGAPTIMLVHGLGVTGWINWGQLTETLASEFDVVTFDLRGHGRGRRGYRFQLEGCADDVAEVATALGIDQFFVAGYSMGGPIAKLCWRRHPDRVLGMVLSATAAEFGRFLNPRRIRFALRLMRTLVMMRPGFVRRRVNAWAVYRLGHIIEPARLEQELAGHRFQTILQAAECLARYSALPWLDDIDVPVSVLVTAGDDRVAPEAQHRLAAAIPGARVIETAGTHTACITDAATFAPDLLAACRDVWRRSSKLAISA